MENNFGLNFPEIDTIQVMNPELSAHNIALAYVISCTKSTKILNGEDVILSDVLSLSNQYVQVYNYAYNFVIHENESVNNAE